MVEIQNLHWVLLFWKVNVKKVYFLNFFYKCFFFFWPHCAAWGVLSSPRIKRALSPPPTPAHTVEMEMGSFIHWITKEFPGKVYFYLMTDDATLGLSPKDSHL